MAYADGVRYDDSGLVQVPQPLGLLPVAILPVVGKVADVLHIGGKSSGPPNQAAAAQVLSEAMRGNLSAIGAILNRSGLQTTVAAAPWLAARAQIEASHPEWIQQGWDNANNPPGGKQWWEYAPEQVMPAVLQYAKYVEAPRTGGPGVVPPLPASVATAGFGNWWLVAAVAGAWLMTRRKGRR